MAVVTSFLQSEKESLLTMPDEWKAKIEELELDGQKSFMGAEQKSPIPFMAMTDEMRRIYQTICPRRMTVKRYDREPIPLEALALISLAIHENYFDEIQIWSAVSGPDPVAVGCKGNSWDYRFFLIAQWGSERASLDVMREQAKAKWITLAKAALSEAATKIRTSIEDIEAIATRHFNGGQAANLSIDVSVVDV
jgi:hypothetical protein